MNGSPQASSKISAGRVKSATHDETHKRLRDAIDDGRLPPGARLPEERLARALNVSRARVREVLSLLARDRLVELHLNRGATVARPTVEEARHICEARLMSERMMARLAAERATAADVARMRDLLAREQAAWSADDIHGAVTASRAFHVAIAEAAANPVLTEMLVTLLSRSALTLSVYASRGRAGCLCDDHKDLLTCIADKDADRAEALMVRHIENMISRMDLEPIPRDVDIEDALRDPA